MGEAKKRGGFEERKAQAQARKKEDASSRLLKPGLTRSSVVMAAIAGMTASTLSNIKTK